MFALVVRKTCETCFYHGHEVAAEVFGKPGLSDLITMSTHVKQQQQSKSVFERDNNVKSLG
jgi:hypothetical protein